MMMDTQTPQHIAPVTAVAEPTPAQLARAMALHRFNGLFVYVPLALLGIATVATVIWLMWTTLAGPTAEVARVDVSAVADLIIIASVLPVTLACLLLPGLAIGLAIYDKEREMSRIEWIQRKLWRVEDGVDWVQGHVAEKAPRIVRPITTLNGWVAYGRTVAARLWHILRGA